LIAFHHDPAAAIPATEAAAPAARLSRWSDSYLGRLEALAAMQDLILRIMLRESATLALDEWCVEQGLGGAVVAEVQPGPSPPVPAAVRADLKVAQDDLIRYRRVKLSCGGRLLSEADNWYVPARLPADVIEMLDRSRTPFGRAVKNLGAHRQTLSGRPLFAPLAPGWERSAPPGAAAAPGSGTGSVPTLRLPEDLYEIRALLTLPSGEPLSEVVETYKRGVLEFTRKEGEAGSPAQASRR
jgi:hypothetical protein